MPLLKYDEETGVFDGVLAEETPDRVGEVFDYATSKPFFEAWSKGFQKATKGKSAGNLRAMHSKIAAGIFTNVEFDDAAKEIRVAGKVIDAAEKVKMAEGVYTGLSIGGHYVKTWADPSDKSLKRYTCEPVEGSLVDLPCMYGATFTARKIGGVEEVRKFRGPVQLWECAYTEKHRHQAKADAIACREAVAQDDLGKLALPVLEKGMYAIGDLAAAIAILNCIRISSKYEEEYEGDNSPVPAAMASIVEQAIEILHQMVDEEGRELLADINADGAELEMWTHGRINKFLARIPAAELVKALELLERTKASIQTLAVKAGPEDEMDEKVLKGMLEESAKAQREEFQKGITDSLAAVNKSIGEQIAGFQKANDEAIAALRTELDVVKKATPAEPKLLIRAVPKTEDTGAAAEKAAEPEKSKDVVELTKAAFARPIPHALSR